MSSETGQHPQECPACADRGGATFFAMRGVPVTCASIFPTRQEALAVPCGDVNLCVCRGCGFVFNRTFDSRLGAVGARYESSQAASAHFSSFAQSLARDWIKRYALSGRTVLDVGCGNADFLKRLLDEGVGRAIGIDPCCEPAERTDRLQLIADLFDDRFLDLAADAVVCRHTLEHIQDVAGFLRLLGNWASRGTGRVLLFELPASERIFAERAFWDVYYEHCNYFTRATIRTAFELAGLRVLRVDLAYDDQYLLVEAVADPQVRRAQGSEVAASAQLECAAFGAAASASIERSRARLARFAESGKRVVIWQGASKTVGFLSAIETFDAIDSAVDMNQRRHGQFLPGSGLAVHSPDILRELQPEHVVLMNPVYVQEVGAQLREMGVDCRLHTINELLE
ncbi:MAG TPA: class I SAM-dependent methyltransferase [Steroidobacteraceae bacterium]|nr:class I SAM-dependent methyltransferase [Steroidobacteraceae bacterium]